MRTDEVIKETSDFIQRKFNEESVSKVFVLNHVIHTSFAATTNDELSSPKHLKQILSALVTFLDSKRGFYIPLNWENFSK